MCDHGNGCCKSCQPTANCVCSERKLDDDYACGGECFIEVQNYRVTVQVTVTAYDYADAKATVAYALARSGLNRPNWKVL